MDKTEFIQLEEFEQEDEFDADDLLDQHRSSKKKRRSRNLIKISMTLYLMS